VRIACKLSLALFGMRRNEGYNAWWIILQTLRNVVQLPDLTKLQRHLHLAVRTAAEQHPSLVS